ncbi:MULTISPECIES: TlpA disulfide reductase family protein [Myroides]|uniref:Redoxin domain-containing protein n=1 Tax=Myroides albus TaxID=2562892 RepID=A0A6I3LMF8_9FLAO|nr:MULTISPECIES: TlpA disulfide reductase family protein [Myroides]MTG97771.1 redoxin domain-containing protein [Myroides albus]MVX35545.1 redoxin domain-containing protein [Myroides sp. LoEW2-1]
MLRKSALLLGIAFLTMSFSSKKHPYTITGSTLQQTNGSYIYLSILDPIKNDFVKTDSTQIKNNTYSFKGTITAPSYAILTTDDINDAFILEQGHIKAYNTPQNINTSSITGTKNNDELDQFTQKVRESQLELTRFKDINQPILENAVQENDGKTIDAISAEFNTLIKKVSDVILDQSANKPNSFTSLVVLYQRLDNDNISREEAYYNYAQLSKELQETNIGQAVKRMIDKTNETKIKVGEYAPDFEAVDLQQNRITLLQNLGKVTILHFWAPWCPSCKETTPFISELFQKYKGEGLKIISIALDEDNEELRKTIQDEKLDWTHISDPATLQIKYGVRTIPTAFIIDKDGVVVDINHLEPSIEDVIKSYLK